jgi:hypothetical protein
MIRRRSHKGTLLLAAAAAAAFAACANNDGSGGSGDGDGDGDGDTGGTSPGDGDGDASGGSNASGGNGSGGANLGGMGGDASGGMGGDASGGMGGDAVGGTGGTEPDPPTAQEIVDAECPAPVGTYTITEGTDDPDSYLTYNLNSPPEAFVMKDGDDLLEISTGEDASIRSCVVGGADDDTLTFYGTASYEGSYDGTARTAVDFIGGEGADTIKYSVSFSSFYRHNRPTFSFPDFEPGVDKFQISHEGSMLFGTGPEDSYPVYVMSSDWTADSAGEIGACTNAFVLLDQTDGQVWLTCTNVAYNELLGTLGDGTETVTAADIEYIP